MSCFSHKFEYDGFMDKTKHIFAERLENLRLAMKSQGLHGYLVPTTDEYLNEYVPLCGRRLEWLTGFSGSWGVALILNAKAALLVDGRYTLQAREEVHRALIEPLLWDASTLKLWMKDHGAENAVIGYDPWVMGAQMLSFFQKACPSCSFRPTESSLIDTLWHDRPLPPRGPLALHPLLYAGEGSAEKRQRVWQNVASHVQAIVLTDLTSLAWLLNVRGQDIPYTPVACMYGVMHRDGWIDVFTSLQGRDFLFRPRDIPQVRWHDAAEWDFFLHHLASQNITLHLDPETCPLAVIQRCETQTVSLVRDQDPCALPKACKNNVELQGAKQAHLRDGVALVRFLAWLFRTLPHSPVTEQSAADQLEIFRQQGDLYQGPSFTTISASGPHGAIVHYMPKPHTNRPLAQDELYLLDSGGQYLDGTTDVTRTMAFGPPTPEQKKHFTHVLKGHIALARAVFPEGTEGSRLDTLARHHVWATGWDYNHGTGHGVGSYLSVHEGPHRLSTRPSRTPLQKGMLLSNEPGLYKPHHYGIRLENVMAVVSAQGLFVHGDSHQSMLAFETLTLVPFDTLCIESSLLTQEERLWLNGYHHRVRELLTPHLDREDALWLHQATKPLIE